MGTERAEARVLAEEWLGGVHEGKELPSTLQELLLDGFDKGQWTESIIPDMDETVQVEDVMELWAAAHEGSADSARAKPRAVDKVMLKQWLKAQYAEDVDEASSRTEPSNQEKEDLAVQGMLKPRDLRRLELATLLGRAVNDSETDGGTYRGVPQSMAAGKLALKYKYETINTALEECIASDSLATLDRHYTTLAAELADSGMPGDAHQATRTLQFWSTTQRNMMNDVRATVAYIRDFRTFYRGRGIPVLYDTEIGMRALFGQGRAQQCHPPSFSGTRSGTSSSGASSLYPSDSVSQIGGGASVAQAEQMEKLMEMMSGLNARVGELATKVANTGGGADRPCPVCGQLGHRASQCPQKLAEKADKAAKRAAKEAAAKEE